METKNKDIKIDENHLNNKELNSKYSIINTLDSKSPEIQISKDNKLFPSNSFYSNAFTLNIDSSLMLKPTKYCYRKKGKTFQFFGNVNGDPLIIIGPHWYFSLILIIIISSLFYIILFYYWISINYIIITLGFILYFLFLISFLYTCLINPGFPVNNIDNILNGDLKDNYNYCDICKVYSSYDNKVFHCKFCDICIEGFDHHCPWTGKCIGKKNFKSFVFFVGVVCISILYFFYIYMTYKIII